MDDNVELLRQRIHELEELNRLAGSLGGAATVGEVLSAIVDASLSLCHARHAAILLFSPFSREVVETLVRSNDPAGGGIDHGLNLIIAGWIGHHGKPLLAADVIEVLQLKTPAEHWRQMGAVLAVPLVSEGRTVGILNMLNLRGGNVFTTESLRLAGTISSMAAQYIVRARLHDTLFQDNIRLKTALRQQHGGREILGKSRPIEELRRKIAAAAGAEATVLLVGETGTGKELAARSIHLSGPRAEKPFVAINCSAIPATLVESELFGYERGAFTGAAGSQKGKFELAHEGTLFLDEIGEMPLELQPKLLRILEEKSFYRLGSTAEFSSDVRVIAATSKDLYAAAQEGKFREDLYHRLSVLPIHLPPLRDRPDDIQLLAEAFLRESSRGARQFTPEALETLRRLRWRGNVRELRNAVERVSIFTHHSQISTEDLRHAGIIAVNGDSSTLTAALQMHLRSSDGEKDLLEDVEKRLVELALHETGGNISRAARMLGIDRSALQRRCEKFKIKTAQDERPD
jgi:transcriptional regulator with GAF, ATPase, and Fis domain